MNFRFIKFFGLFLPVLYCIYKDAKLLLYSAVGYYFVYSKIYNYTMTCASAFYFKYYF
jgi:hypothetical protein